MKAAIGVGGIKVQTRKLNNPAIAPMAVPAFIPIVNAVITTGTIINVATIGPIAGNEPRGVKQKTASIATSIEN